MKIFLTTAIWGDKYVDIFSHYSLASLLSKNNIPLVSSVHKLTLHLITTKADYQRLTKKRSFKIINDLDVEVIVSFIEEVFASEKLVIGYSNKKYKFLSKLQNFAIKMSEKYDVIVFNYSDFVWGDGALLNTVTKLDEGFEAVLGFCMPVDLGKCKNKLESLIHKDGYLNVDNLTASNISISAMHREAMLRYWNAPIFTVTPTYLMWKVPDEEGVVLRAYHQTIFALKTNFFNKGFSENLGSSLDGYYSSLVVENSNYFVADNSESICVFSLYETIIDSRLVGHKTKNDSLRECLTCVVSEANRKLAIDHPIMLRTSNISNIKKWDDVKHESVEILKDLHDDIVFNRAEHEKLYTLDADSNVSDGNIYLINVIKKIIIKLGLSNDVINIILKIKRILFKKKINQNYSLKKSIICNFLAYACKYKVLNLYSELLLIRWFRGLYKYIYLNHAIESQIDNYFSGLIFLEIEKLMKFGDVNLADNNLKLIDDKFNRLINNTDFIGFKYNNAVGQIAHILGYIEDSKFHFDSSEKIRSRLLKIAYFGDSNLVILSGDTLSSIGMLSHLDAFIIHKKINNNKYNFYIIKNELRVANEYFANLFSDNVNFTNRDEIKSYLKDYSYVVNDYLLDLLTVNWHWYIYKSKNNLVSSQFIHEFINSNYRININFNMSGLNEKYKFSKSNLNEFYNYFKVSEVERICCIHIRSFNYWSGKENKQNESFRTPSLSNYLLLLDQLIKENYLVVLMGDPLDSSELQLITSQHFSENVLAYSNSVIKSDFLDIELIANCDLFIASPSGLYGVASIFNKRILLIDYPLYSGLPWRAGQYILPLRYFNRKKIQYFNECEYDTLGLFTHGFCQSANGVETHFNSQDDILNGYFKFKSAEDIAASNPIIEIPHPLISHKLNSRLGQGRKIDVLIPTRNRPGKLFQLLKSGIGLCFSDITFYIFDDGSIERDYIEGIGLLTTFQVCNYFDSSQIIYKSCNTSIGVAAHWEAYFSSDDVADYIMAIPDKDIFISNNALQEAINLIENDDDVALVIAPLVQIDRTESERIFDVRYKKMDDISFYKAYVNDNSLQHCSMWGIFRTKFALEKLLPKSLNLRKYGLDDGFGIDLNFVMNMVMDKKIDFISNPIIKRSTLLGGTERYPLTFAYTYYQYALNIFNQLKHINKIDKKTYKKYLFWWNILILRGLNVSFNHVYGSELERGTERIKKHLKLNIHLYLLIQMINYKFMPNIEYMGLFSRTLKKTLGNVVIKVADISPKVIIIAIRKKLTLQTF